MELREALAVERAPDLPSRSDCPDDPGPAKPVQMPGEQRLRQAKPDGKGRDRVFALGGQELQDAQPGVITECSVIRAQIAR